MTPEEYQSILVPGAKLEAFIIEPEKAERMIREVEIKQEQILSLKKLDYAELERTYIAI